MEGFETDTIPIISPLQPALINKPNYQEHTQTWNGHVPKGEALFYQFDSGEEEHATLLIPDACVDFLFSLGPSPKGVILGSRLKETHIQLKANTRYFGFKPYSVDSMRSLGLNWGSLLNSEVSFSQLFPQVNIEKQLAEARTFKEKINLWLAFATKFLLKSTEANSLVGKSEVLICGAKGLIKIERMCQLSGYTERHCRQKFKEVHGFTMKKYNDIIRFQNSVRLLLASSTSADRDSQITFDIIFANDYYDQSHFIREFKTFSNLTPTHFKRIYSIDK
ncbi:helix-turn-helix transcriptional regulator [Vagococcus sp. BWB3-3]|uniref:Helix-turn-helix transcriptional regulator n=1 Tax=Vagococcus allomyrinae TaxID=2794353 RepID=A0A940SVE3_9ENTE|nr:AraC family transcriptional regulator [Vagococcus allomyrinae]MBP1042255.1 helix-turn-helix transcriptional regulator [Vagococcus allomyrinae]